jgi:uncharacterized membrane protein YeaQ/YmgE (transglycosylase-associated protein family)
MAQKAILIGGYAGRKVGAKPDRYKEVAVIGAILLGLFCGIVARILVPNDAFRHMSGPVSWLVSLGLGLLGALVGTVIVLLIFTFVMRRRARTSSPG